jgi:hypothetical protein
VGRSWAIRLAAVPTDSSPTTVPSPLKIAAAVVALEGLVVAILGIGEAIKIDASRLVLGLTTAVFLLLYGAGLVLVARGLYRTASWSRSPAVLAQLIQLGLAWNFRGGSTSWVSVLLALAGAGVLVAMFRKASRDALADDPTRDGPVF